MMMEQPPSDELLQQQEQQQQTPLELKTVIGFSGSVPNALLRHPDGVHMLYPLGSNVIIRNTKTGEQRFLQGHTNSVSCIALSKSGSQVATGQVTHMGFQADIILWDFATRKAMRVFTLHKVKVQSLAFSPAEKYLVSLGGEDDNAVIVWDLERGSAICGATASKDSTGVASCIAFSNHDDNVFVTGGDANLRVWEINVTQRKVKPADCQMGAIRRNVKCIRIDDKDEFLYCGTTSGDLLQVSLKTQLFKNAGPAKDKDGQENFSLGILTVAIADDAQTIVVGAGDGTIAAMNLATFKIVKRTKVNGSVTSIAFTSPTSLYAGTSQSNIYHLSLDTFEPVCKMTCHYAPANDICFPEESSDLFATASDHDIRIWNALTAEELLRIVVPNQECKSIVFKKDGTSLISGWTDGKIRAFGPQSGRLQYEINDAHKKCVSALAVTDLISEQGDFKLVSGGDDGQVRIWRIKRHVQTLENAMKEHKGMVTCVKIRRNNQECVSSSSDGSCIVWDLNRFVRNQVLFAPSFFKAVVYYPDESQLLTSGTDRKVAYWEAFDGSLIREIEASQSDAINGLDITHDGKYFVVGGSDKLIKVYLYEEGTVIHLGVGHSTDIAKVKISPDQRHIVSVSMDGAIFRWDFGQGALGDGAE
ncbi:hypothetical protein RI367_004927 [Sorochytrium milnesiophthora]